MTEAGHIGPGRHVESMVGVGERRSLEPSAWWGGQGWEPKPAFVPSLHSRRWWTFLPVSVSRCHDKSRNKQNHDLSGV